MWTNASMARAINWERRRFDGKRTLNIKDESEFRKGDVAARWLVRRESEIAAKKRQAAKPRTTTRKSSWQGKKLKPGTGMTALNLTPPSTHWEANLTDAIKSVTANCEIDLSAQRLAIGTHNYQWLTTQRLCEAFLGEYLPANKRQPSRHYADTIRSADFLLCPETLMGPELSMGRPNADVSDSH
jgi:hypothetical protein